MLDYLFFLDLVCYFLVFCLAFDDLIADILPVLSTTLFGLCFCTSADLHIKQTFLQLSLCHSRMHLQTTPPSVTYIYIYNFSTIILEDVTLTWVKTETYTMPAINIIIALVLTQMLTNVLVDLSASLDYSI